MHFRLCKVVGREKAKAAGIIEGDGVAEEGGNGQLEVGGAEQLLFFFLFSFSELGEGLFFPFVF